MSANKPDNGDTSMTAIEHDMMALYYMLLLSELGWEFV